MSRPPAESSALSAQYVVDAAVLSHGRLSWQREIRGVEFARLVEAAVSATPPVSIKLHFDILDHKPVIHGEVQAMLTLVCQRCMGNMQYPVRESFDLMLIEHDAELAAVPDTHEPWLTKPTHLEILPLLEEQLLLALPLIAKHAEVQDCASAPRKPSVASAVLQVPSSVQRPFDSLRDLLRK